LAPATFQGKVTLTVSSYTKSLPNTIPPFKVHRSPHLDKFGCVEYGRCGTCPPATPSVVECKDFFNEYSDAVILHFEGLMAKPEDRHAWSSKINAKLVKLERAVFIAGFERAFQLFMDSCCICKDCTGNRETCEQPRMARPAPEAMAVDVYTTVRQAGFKINVLLNYDQKMDRFAFLMVH
jgi:predicted metal-binding protein